MGFLPPDMNAVLAKVPLSDFVPAHNTIYRPILRQGGPVKKIRTWFYCTQDAKWRPGVGGGGKRVIVSFEF